MRAARSEFCLDARTRKFKLNVAVELHCPPKYPEPEHLDPPSSAHADPERWLVGLSRSCTCNDEKRLRDSVVLRNAMLDGMALLGV
jgi:hypothetical protein